MNSPLFRSEALAARRQAQEGAPLNLSSVQNVFLIILAIVIASSLICLVSLGEYTKRSTVSGVVLASGGVVKIFPPQSGFVRRVFVREGQRVAKGQPLLELTNDFEEGSSRIGVKARAEEELRARSNSLEKSIVLLEESLKSEFNSLRLKRKSLQEEHHRIQAQRQNQAGRLKMSQAALERQEELLSFGFISKDALRTRQEDLFDQQAKDVALSREEVVLQRELAMTVAEIESFPTKVKIQVGELERQYRTARLEVIESEARRRGILSATVEGQFEGLSVQVGQPCDPSKPVAKIIQDLDSPVAELYVPSQAIGGVTVGQSVAMRISAFPYQKYGQVLGTISAISRAPITQGESIEAQFLPGSALGVIYRVRVSFRPKPELSPLLNGMTIDADIELDRRKIYEWILEPLIGLRRKLN